MKPSVYVETTIPSYLTAQPSRDLVFTANQQITRDWWDGRRSGFDLYISQFVLDEAAAGDPSAAARRLDALRNLPLLEADDACHELARNLLARVPIPLRATNDAFHVALAAVNGMDYLLTWNCTHIANAVLRPRIQSVCIAFGVGPPVICTPLELMEGPADVERSNR